MVEVLYLCVFQFFFFFLSFVDILALVFYALRDTQRKQDGGVHKFYADFYRFVVYINSLFYQHSGIFAGWNLMLIRSVEDNGIDKVGHKKHQSGKTASILLRKFAQLMQNIWKKLQHFSESFVWSFALFLSLEIKILHSLSVYAKHILFNLSTK